MQNEFKLPRKHKVIFKGSLKKFGEFEVAGYTAADCIRGVAIQIPELYIIIMNGYFTVRHRKGKFKENMTIEMATREIFNYNEQQVIEVIPVVKGATGSQAGDTAVAGAALIVSAIIIGLVTWGVGSAAAIAIGTTTLSSILYSTATSLAITGLSLLATGIAGLVAKQEEDKEEETKYSWNGPTNISKQGVAIPLIYGKIGVGSNLVSSLVGKIYGTPEFPAGEIHSGVSSTLRITELLGEGEIYGLVDGEKSVLLNGVPLVREDGTKTFPNTSVTFCTGVNNIRDPYADGVNTPMSGGGAFEDGIWQTFTVADPQTDRININLRFNALYYQDNSDGHTDMLTTTFEAQVAGADLVWQLASFNTAGNKVEEKCVTQTIYSKVSTYGQGVSAGEGESFWQYKHEWNWIDCEGNPRTQTEITDYKSVTEQEKSKPLTVTVKEIQQTQTSSFTPGYFNVRAKTKTTLELTIQLDVTVLDRTKPRYFRIRQLKAHGKNTYVDDCTLTMYSEQIDLKMNYEGRAIVYMGLNAQDFQGNLPSRVYEVKGLIIDVPSNYDPETRQYSGIWDGTFKKAWTNNPVWVFYDLLTNGRYGLGRDIGKDNVDKWSLYYASMYCDELVSDGNGGKEPRFTFNGVINSREDAYTVLSNVAGVFRSMLFAANNQIFLAQDAPQTPKRTFGNINVIGGMFQYEGSATTARHTAVEVTWINPDNTWQTEKEIYEDGELIQRYGYNVKSVTALGCTSKGQAQRIARHTIYSEEYENDTVSFQVGLQDSDVRPGDIIYIQDEMIAGEVLMGVIKKITRQTIIIDRTVMMTMGRTYSIMLTDNYGNNYTKNLVNREMETDTLWIRSDEFFTQEQIKNFTGASFWTLISDGVRPRKFRVLGVVEEADEGGAKFTITALLHFDEKYKLIDENIRFDRPPISAQPYGELQAPVSFQARQSLKKVEGSIVASSDCSWGLPSDVRVSAVEVKISYPNSEGFVEYGLMTNTHLNIENTGVGEMRAKLRSYSNITKTYSQEVEFIVQLDNHYVNPPMPMNLTGETVGGVGVFKWDKPLYAFPLTYEYYFITPHGTDTAVVTTNNSASISRAFNKYPATVAIYVRSINEVGMMSDYAKTSIQVTPADLSISDFLEDIDTSWLTGDTQQMLGAGGLIEQISVALMRQESYMVYRIDNTDNSLAIAVEGLSVLTEDHKALASKVTFLGSFVGEQLTSNDPNKFNLKWYDGSDPAYPQTPNPLYKPDEPLSVENYPYLPVYPNQSLGGYLMEVYSGDDFVKGQITNSLRADMNKVTTEIKNEMITTINENGEIETGYVVRIDGTNREGQPVIGGFGLHSDGYNTHFGVNAHTFYIKDPNWKGTPTNIFDGFLFVTDNQRNITYIGTDNTIYKGKFQDLNYSTTGIGLNFDTANATYEVSSSDIVFKIDNDGHIRIYKKKIENSQTSNKLIVDIGASNTIGYSHVMHVRPIDFTTFSGILAEIPSGTYSTTQASYVGSSTENAGILVKGGITGLKDITQDSCSFIIHNQQSLEVRNFVQDHSNLQLSHYNLEIDLSTGSTQRLDQEIASYNIMLTYFILNTLNNMLLADVGTLITLPHPFVLNDNSYRYCVLKTDLWFKQQSGKNFQGQYGSASGLAQKQPLFNSNGSFAYCWFDDMIGNSNRFRWYFPRIFAGWERLTNLSYKTVGVYQTIPGSDGGNASSVLKDVGSTYIGSWYNLKPNTEIKPTSLTGNLPYTIQYT